MSCYWGRGEEFLQLPSFHTILQVHEIHKHEKHFQVSPKESHKVEILARIYFSVTE
jgi:hypothetical protein